MLLKPTYSEMIDVLLKPTYSEVKLLSDIYCIGYSLIWPSKVTTGIGNGSIGGGGGTPHNS